MKLKAKQSLNVEVLYPSASRTCTRGILAGQVLTYKGGRTWQIQHQVMDLDIPEPWAAFFDDVSDGAVVAMPVAKPAAEAATVVAKKEEPAEEVVENIESELATEVDIDADSEADTVDEEQAKTEN